MDNDDFEIDPLTTDATGAYQTNVLCMQIDSYEEESNNDSTTAQNVTKKEMSKEMDVKCKELTKGQQYVCPRGAGSEPPLRETVALSKAVQRPQRFRSAIYAIARTSFSGERHSGEQQSVPSYVGFQSCIFSCTRKSKAYDRVTYNESPKNMVCHAHSW